MNNLYGEILEQLRTQHSKNQEEVYHKCNQPNNHYHNEKYVQDDMNNHSSWTFSIRLKVFVFIAAVLSFSCYIYGGQDIAKGASMAYSEMKNQLFILEKEEPLVRTTMGYVRRVYKGARELANEYIIDDTTNQ